MEEVGARGSFLLIFFIHPFFFFLFICSVFSFFLPSPCPSLSLFIYLFSLQMSSFIFFVVAPIMLYLLHPYAKERNLAVHLVWLMMIFVGECSLVLTCLTIATCLPVPMTTPHFISHSHAE